MNIEKAYGRFCKARFPLPSEKQVANLEKRFGIPFPPDYRRWLLDYNGGYFREPERDIVPPDDECPLDGLDVLAGINATHPSAELGAPGIYTPATFDDNDPPQLLPIGYTIMGNLLFMSSEPGADDWGHIGLKLASSTKSFFLANGIEEFFELLREPEENASTT